MLPKKLNKVIDAIRKQGGKPYLVGGAVRDSLLQGKLSKDFDIEVYNLDVDDLIALLKPLGRLSQVGKSFGVLLLKVEGYTLDISVPRKESKKGRGHKGFIINPDPSLSPEEAASRRDYTINALMYDFSTESILDFYGGKLDLQQGILRHINEYFSDDPLRVLRGFQFASRFNMRLDPGTAKFCFKLFDEYQELPRERIWNEWFKWATKANYPSQGLKFLVDCGWIGHYPQIEALIGCNQNPEWHPEGDVFVHTCYVVDAAAEIASREGLWGSSLEAKKAENKRLGLDRAQLLLASLCHDFGKPATTEWTPDGKGTPGTECWRSPAHDKAGVAPTLQFLDAIGCPKLLRTRIPLLVKEHLAHIGAASARAVNRLARRLHPVTIEELIYVIEADVNGRPPKPKGLPESVHEMLRLAKTAKVIKDVPQPIITGKLLIQSQLCEPGPAMGKMLKATLEAQLAEKFSTVEEGMKWIKQNLP